ncbi:MAG: LysM peptidoglycan-binding domain-containing protein [Phycisphaerales bacterium]
MHTCAREGLRGWSAWRGWLAVVAVGLAVLAWPGRAAGQSGSQPGGSGESPSTYTIQSGDTLGTIAQRTYGSTRFVNDILAANPGLNPRRLMPGQVITLPVLATGERPAASAGSEPGSSGASTTPAAQPGGDSSAAAQPAGTAGNSNVSGATAAPASERYEPQAIVPEGSSVTRHSVTIDGRRVDYTATAGYMTLPDYEGQPRASVFYVAYVRDGVGDMATRPITFAFNGGPGSSSVWLHMGALGPRRVLMDEEGFPLPPPYRLVENEQSWLDLTDLVFIDPVSTGYSRPVEGVRASSFHGFTADVESVGDFIRLYTTREHRWASPKFLAGESYGTTRAAGLAGYLQNTHGMYLNGIILVSSVLNFQTVRFAVGNDTPYWLYLPTYAATAWYHGRLDEATQARPLEEFLDEVKRWASTEYVVALAQGDDLSDEARERIGQRLSQYTGLSEAFVDATNLRINITNFTKELMRDQGRTVGRLDSRFSGIDRDSVGDGPDHDPSMTAIWGPYTAVLNDYVRRDLGYENDLVYEILTGRVQPWSYSNVENRYLNVGETLREAISKNPDLWVLVASGYYDLATPFFASDYVVTHLGLEEGLRDNVVRTYYESGHMMYIREFDLRKLRADVAEFFAAALGW